MPPRSSILRREGKSALIPRQAAPRSVHHAAPRLREPADAVWLPDEALFLALHRPGASIAVRLELADPGWDAADLVEPLSRGGIAYLLETAGGPPDLARRTILAWDPEYEILLYGDRLETRAGARVVRRQRTRAPLAALRALCAAEGAASSPYADGFSGGLIGYVSYDFKNHLERLPDTVRDDLGLPELRFGCVRRVLVWDRGAGTLSLRISLRCGNDPRRDWQRGRASLLQLWATVCQAAATRAPGRAAAARVQAIAPAAPQRASRSDAAPATLRSNLTRPEYDRMLARCREHIFAGDIYQANLSHRFSTPFDGDGLELYRHLRTINPSPFAAYLRFPEHEVVSCSPERLVKVEHGRVETRPIAGTRPRGDDRDADRRLQRDLLANEKERAEHLMIVDMARNDIGRVCEAGSVEVESFMRVEAYSHVRHLVSNVTGSLRSDRDAFDVLAATFPGASITGVPKVRCMEIIDALELVRRGIYTGSAGYIGLDGAMDFNILIRTFLLQDGQASYHVGGGIVADSRPEREYEETLAKGRALCEALLAAAPAARPRAHRAGAAPAQRARHRTGVAS
jgi:aminodeoxychorismate synthase component I